MGEIRFIKFKGGAGAWPQESRVVTDTTFWDRLFQSAIVHEKNYIFLYRVR